MSHMQHVQQFFPMLGFVLGQQEFTPQVPLQVFAVGLTLACLFNSSKFI
jgi:hypothetical protein